jgi:hypothetical protein
MVFSGLQGYDNRNATTAMWALREANVKPNRYKPASSKARREATWQFMPQFNSSAVQFLLHSRKPSPNIVFQKNTPQAASLSLFGCISVLVC